MGVVINLSMLFVVTVSAHSDWLAILNGSTAAVIARHLCLVHLAVLSRANFLLNTQWPYDSHMQHAFCDSHVIVTCNIKFVYTVQLNYPNFNYPVMIESCDIHVVT